MIDPGFLGCPFGLQENPGELTNWASRWGVMDRIGYVSTAGGAFLEFLEGRVLPGVAALDEAA